MPADGLHGGHRALSALILSVTFVPAVVSMPLLTLLVLPALG